MINFNKSGDPVLAVVKWIGYFMWLSWSAIIMIIIIIIIIIINNNNNNNNNVVFYFDSFI